MEQAFLHHQSVFKELATQVSAIEAAVKKYEKKVSGTLQHLNQYQNNHLLAIAPALNKVAESLSAFYANDDLASNAHSFSKSTSNVSLAIETFSSDMAKYIINITHYLNISISRAFFSSILEHCHLRPTQFLFIVE